MSRKINIYQTVENVMFKWPYDSYDAVVSLHGKDEALNNNGLYLAIAFGEGDEECDYGITIDKDFIMHLAKRYYGTWVTGQYCEIAFEEFDIEELILNYLLTIKYDDE